jgi:hypothetical protein
MKMTADIEQRFAAVDDTLATLDERLCAAERCAAEFTKKVDSISRLLGSWLDQQAKQAVDPQALMINARVGERQAKGGGAPTAAAAPVQFGSATPHDAQVGRIDGKRRELLGKK